MEKQDLLKKRRRVICVSIPTVLLDWMDTMIAKGRYRFYAEAIREGLYIVKSKEEGDIFISNRRE